MRKACFLSLKGEHVNIQLLPYSKMDAILDFKW